MPVQLRKRAPYWCSHKTLAGKPDHLDYALAETDTDVCPTHKAEAEELRRRFFEAPIVKTPEPAAPAQDEAPAAPWPIWPVDPVDRDIADKDADAKLAAVAEPLGDMVAAGEMTQDQAEAELKQLGLF